MTNAAPTIPTRPFLAIYVAWHPHFREGADLGLALFKHYRRDLYQNVAGGSGVPVMYRFEPPKGSSVPIDIDLNSAETCAVILLVDSYWSEDSEWVAWAR